MDNNRKAGKPDETEAKLISALQRARGTVSQPEDPKRNQILARLSKTRRRTPAPAPLEVPIEPPKIRKTVFWSSAILVIAIALWATVAAEQAAAALGAMVTWVSNHFGWFYILTGTVVVIFMAVVAMGRSGRIRLGPDHSRPQYSLYSWVAMLFAAGIGVDLLFFSVAEPVYQFYNPPAGEPETIEAARQAVVLTMFHYGITGWAMYAMMGMAFGYFAYRFNMPLSIRSALYPLLGKRVKGLAGDMVDIAAQLGTIFGVATSLGIGVVQLNYGLKILFGVEEGLTAQFALVMIAVTIATISAVSGVDKGIKRLSQINVGMAIGLLIYILLTGRTTFLMDSLVMNVGQYFATFPSLTMDTYAFNPMAHEWLNSWTIFFWAWWVAWAPFVGLFLARISRGRTLRQFVIGTLFLPFLFIVLWVSIFGNSALDLVFNKKDAQFGKMAVDAPEQAFYLLLEQYPLAPAVMIVASVVGLLLYVTSADSAALVMSNFTSRITGASQDGPRWSRVFWAVATGALTLGMLKVGGIPALQMATIVVGLPFAVVIYLIMWGLYRSLRLEAIRVDAVVPSVSTPDLRSWSQRIAYAVSYPGESEVRKFILETAKPALEDVATALRDQGLQVSLDDSNVAEMDLPQLDLQVGTTDEQTFRYQLYPVPYAMPSYALRLDPNEDRYFRVEAFALTGSLGYDVMGYTKEQVIGDAVDRWEEYQEFLRKQDDLHGSSDVSGENQFSDWSGDF